MKTKLRKKLRDIQTWSVGVDRLFGDEIHNAVMNDPRTTNDGNINPLGFPYGLIQPKVLQNGRADFSKAYKHNTHGKLSASDRVLLYCYMNLRGHFHSSRINFKFREKWLLKSFMDCKPLMIDIGCGPATTALAFADLYPNKKFSYIGVDSAKAMRKRGMSFVSAAKQRGVMHSANAVSFESSWNSLAATFPTAGTIMFNFAFFFASKTLRSADITSLAEKVEQIASRHRTRSVIVSYTNSQHEIANVNYCKFLDILRVQPRSGRSNHTVQYRNRRNQSGTPSKQEFARELFELEL